MARWTESVRSELAVYAEETGETVVDLQDLYGSVVPALETLYPENDHVRAKLRQQLQRLRDEGDLEFLDDGGRYRLTFLEEPSPASDDAETTASDWVDGIAVDDRLAGVERAVSVRDELRRDRALADRTKQRHGFRCQLCGDRRRDGAGGRYAECHHVRPLGRPHHGPDIPENMLVVCPNHHADLDHGVVSIEPDTRSLAHPDESLGTLRSVEGHTVGTEFLRYHQSRLVDS